MENSKTCKWTDQLLDGFCKELGYLSRQLLTPKSLSKGQWGRLVELVELMTVRLTYTDAVFMVGDPMIDQHNELFIKPTFDKLRNQFCFFLKLSTSLSMDLITRLKRQIKAQLEPKLESDQLCALCKNHRRHAELIEAKSLMTGDQEEVQSIADKVFAQKSKASQQTGMMELVSEDSLRMTELAIQNCSTQVNDYIRLIESVVEQSNQIVAQNKIDTSYLQKAQISSVKVEAMIENYLAQLPKSLRVLFDRINHVNKIARIKKVSHASVQTEADHQVEDRLHNIEHQNLELRFALTTKKDENRVLNNKNKTLQIEISCLKSQLRSLGSELEKAFLNEQQLKSQSQKGLSRKAFIREAGVNKQSDKSDAISKVMNKTIENVLSPKHRNKVIGISESSSMGYQSRMNGPSSKNNSKNKYSQGQGLISGEDEKNKFKSYQNTDSAFQGPSMTSEIIPQLATSHKSVRKSVNLERLENESQINKEASTRKTHQKKVSVLRTDLLNKTIRSEGKNISNRIDEVLEPLKDDESSTAKGKQFEYRVNFTLDSNGNQPLEKQEPQINIKQDNFDHKESFKSKPTIQKINQQRNSLQKNEKSYTITENSHTSSFLEQKKQTALEETKSAEGNQKITSNILPLISPRNNQITANIVEEPILNKKSNELKSKKEITISTTQLLEGTQLLSPKLNQLFSLQNSQQTTPLNSDRTFDVRSARTSTLVKDSQRSMQKYAASPLEAKNVCSSLNLRSLERNTEGVPASLLQKLIGNAILHKESNIRQSNAMTQRKRKQSDKSNTKVQENTHKSQYKFKFNKPISSKQLQIVLERFCDRNFLRLFISRRISLKFQKQSFKCHANPINAISSFKASMVTQFCYEIFQMLAQLRKISLNCYQQICRFLQHPYESVEGAMLCLDQVQLQEFQVFQTHFHKILTLHNNCMVQDSQDSHPVICKHLNDFKDDINVVLGLVSNSKLQGFITSDKARESTSY